MDVVCAGVVYQIVGLSPRFNTNAIGIACAGIVCYCGVVTHNVDSACIVTTSAVCHNVISTADLNPVSCVPDAGVVCKRVEMGVL